MILSFRALTFRRSLFKSSSAYRNTARRTTSSAASSTSSSTSSSYNWHHTQESDVSMEKRPPNEEFLAYLRELSELARQSNEQYPHVLGYPMNMKEVDAMQRVSQAISLETNFHVLNNCLDPFGAHSASHWKNHSLQQERKLLDQMIERWGGSVGDSSYWGYLSTGGTEGNLKAISFGLSRLGPPSSRTDDTLVIFSRDAHFSISKICKSLRASYCVCDTIPGGAMSLSSLDQILQVAKRMNVNNFVLVATIGTTFTGANDEIFAIRDMFYKHGYSDDNVHVHLDAALSGGFWHEENPDVAPRYQLGKDIDSLAISAHKWYGACVAGAVLLSKATQDEKFSSYVPYLGFNDRMISGSRDGLVAPKWLARIKQFDWKTEYQQCQRVLSYFNQRLRERGIYAFSHPASVISVFPSPSSSMCDYYQLATQGNLAHACIMPHVTEKEVDTFIESLEACGDLVSMRQYCASLPEQKSIDEWPFP